MAFEAFIGFFDGSWLEELANLTHHSDHMELSRVQEIDTVARYYPPLPEGHHYETNPNPEGGPDIITTAKGVDGVDGGFVRDPVSHRKFWVTGPGRYGWVTQPNGVREWSWILDGSVFKKY